jgi:hypothetical protein
MNTLRGLFYPSQFLQRADLKTHISQIWHGTPRLIWFNCAEGIVLGGCTLLSQKVKQWALANVWQPDTSHLKIISDSSKSNGIAFNIFGTLFGRHVSVLWRNWTLNKILVLKTEFWTFLCVRYYYCLKDCTSNVGKRRGGVGRGGIRCTKPFFIILSNMRAWLIFYLNC